MSCSPGPWKKDGTQIIDANEDFVADCLSHYGDGSSRDHDNAQMVAAAWDMLAALKDIRERLQYPSPLVPTVTLLNNLDTIIAEAEGHAHPTSPEPGDNPALG